MSSERSQFDDVHGWDGLGRQVSRSQAGSRTDLWFHQSGLSLESGASARTYLRDPSGVPLSVFSGSLSDLGRDRLGSVTAQISTAQALSGSLTYDPWGQTLAATGSITSNLRFSGARRDPLTGYAQLGVRAYWWSLGRFTQPDPLPSSVSDLNRYAYAGCNPTNYVDPTGLASCLGLEVGLGLAAGPLWAAVGLTGEATIATAAVAGPVALIPAVAFGASLFAAVAVSDLWVQSATRECSGITLWW